MITWIEKVFFSRRKDPWDEAPDFFKTHRDQLAIISDWMTANDIPTTMGYNANRDTVEFRGEEGEEHFRIVASPRVEGKPRALVYHHRLPNDVRGMLGRVFEANGIAFLEDRRNIA